MRNYILAGVTILVLLEHASFSAAVNVPDAIRRPHVCVVHAEPIKPLPVAWYDAIGVPSIERLIGVEGCYAVVRVERGFLGGTVGGQYLVVTLLFKKSGLDVCGKTLSLDEYETEYRGKIYALAGGRLTTADKTLRDKITEHLTTECSLVNFEDVARKKGSAGWAAPLNYWGIGTLPSVSTTSMYSPLPMVSFQKYIDMDGKEVWGLLEAGGARGGNSAPMWRFTVAVAKGDWWKPECEVRFRHEFTVIDPLCIHDVRYEKILLAIAEVSPTLKTALDEEYGRIAAWQEKWLSMQQPGSSAKKETLHVVKAAPKEKALEDDVVSRSTFIPLLISAVIGMVLGAGFVLILVGKRRR